MVIADEGTPEIAKIRRLLHNRQDMDDIYLIMAYVFVSADLWFADSS